MLSLRSLCADHVEDGIEERAGLECAEMDPIDAGDPRERGMDGLVVRIEPEMADDPLGMRARVVAEEAEDAEPHKQGRRAADQLERADDLQADVATLMMNRATLTGVNFRAIS